MKIKPIRTKKDHKEALSRIESLWHSKKQAFGGRNRVSEILSKKRKLTVQMIRKLTKHLEIPAESLLG